MEHVDDGDARVTHEAWALNVPGLSADDAHRIAEDLAGRYDVSVHPLDPRHWYTRSLDRTTAAAVARALAASAEQAGEETVDAMGFLEDLHEWLDDVAEPADHDDT